MTAMIFEPGLQQADIEAEKPASLASLFAAACDRFENRVAVTIGAEHRSYAQLGAEAGRVAGALAAAGVGRGHIVAILLERSIDMVAAMLGVVQAGATYLPLDTSFPPARLQETLADAKPSLLLTQDALVAALDTAGLTVLLMTGLGVEATPRVQVFPDDIAYIIYTSGSTGRPKGVRVTHDNVVRLFTATDRWFSFREHDVWTMFHSFAFDFSVWEMWGALLTGGRLVLVPFAISRSPEAFYALLAQERITVLNQTPSAFQLLSDTDARGPHRDLSLRVVILGGEALTFGSLKTWFARHGEAQPQIINMYGITETTVHVTYKRVLAHDAANDRDSLIGEPIGDLQLHLLDSFLRPVADGETGELCIGGAGVAAGYLNRPELTAERFVQNPFQPAGARMYRSGDLGRRRTDGELVYLGREDRQVKVNGFRIELGEIEALLAKCAGVTQSCVAAELDSDRGTRLAAYFAGPAEVSQVSAWLAAKLPGHMRPSFYTRLPNLPLNSNGKLDRAALPTLRATLPSTGADSAMESRVAAIWARILGHSAFSTQDNFFEVGGTSLLLIAVRSALQQDLAKSIPITWMFELSSIQALAARLAEQEPVQPQDSGRIDERARQQRGSFARARHQRGLGQ